MTVEEIAHSYYEAWQEKGGDFSEVPLAEDFYDGEELRKAMGGNGG